MKQFGGPALVLDRKDINTDEIIPAKYLTEISKEALRPFLLEDLKLAGFDPKGKARQRAKGVVSRANFGCGSSREHAVWAFEVNGIDLVIAESFARIFRQNMFNCGLLAVELPAADIDAIIRLAAEAEVEVLADLATGNVRVFCTATGKKLACPFSLNAFDRDLVEAGGWLAYADRKY